MENGYRQWLQQQGFGAVIGQQSLGGGCINDSCILKTDNGHSLVLKQHSAPPPDFFRAEAEGLLAIAATKAIRTPNVIHAADDYLLLEYIPAASRKEDSYWETLGKSLANMHTLPQPSFGFTGDNYCGLTPQPNPRCDDGYVFFGEHRLRFQGELASKRGLIDAKLTEQLHRLIDRLPQLIPTQPSSLLHGDLWSGNLHTDEAGAPVLIDPAAHWGWAEAELAMTRLFGGFDDDFYRSYEYHFPLQAGWQERVPLYNLYHLLNHLNLFGGGYLASVKAVIAKFV